MQQEHTAEIKMGVKEEIQYEEQQAEALRDNRNIQLIGEKSFGKGSVQEAITLKDGRSILKVTIAKWLTPKGASISEVGLNPDVKVANTDGDIEAQKDPQLDKALEMIKSLK